MWRSRQRVGGKMRKPVLFTTAVSCLLSTAVVMATERAEKGWEMIQQGAWVVDVRTADEYAQGHLDNSVNFPLSEIQHHFANVDKDQPVVVYCRSGNRSGQAMNYLKSKGFTQVHNGGGLEEMLSEQ